MSDRDDVRALREWILTESPGVEDPTWSGRLESRLTAFLAEREAEALRLPDEVEALRWLYHGGDVEDLEPIRGTLAAMLQEHANSENRAIQKKWRALGEGAGLRGAMKEVVSNAARHSGCLYCGSAPGDGHSGWCPALALRAALTSSPLSERAGEFIQASLEFHASTDPFDRTEARFHETADALLDELARDGGAND